MAKPKIFLTSDTFFGRSQIIEIANRPFADVEEMNEELIKLWNKVVGVDDIVYHLGNFAWSPVVADDVLKKLNGNITFMVGEYDDALLEIADYYEGIKVLANDIHKDYDNKLLLSHWPLAEWPGKEKGIYHFHGHSLKNLKTNLKEMNRINICCDNWNYTPQELNSLFEIFNSFKSDKTA